ncbi:hypothetical protein ABZX72_04710 [Streptomyces cyaneofuscatus]|uniref:hypothetical protein n=1 Tax=Streptomyces griseus group TaxID=629295 RepID=UPI0033B6E7E9
MTDLATLFRRGEVYADSWSVEVRRQLNVEDTLVGLVTQALNDGRHVVITGNAGDGKSHLLSMALDASAPKPSIEADDRSPAALTPGDRLFIRDAATLDDAAILAWTDAAIANGSQLVITLNEGPLSSLARRQGEGLYEQVREVTHARARGEMMDDPGSVLLVNLAGRQLVHAGFVTRALERLLPAVDPCRTCGDDTTCPRTAGRDLLARSPQAADRLTKLLSLLGQSGLRLTARELWVFLAELFFGWQCPPRGRDVQKLAGWWWSRVFDPATSLGRMISREFDPIHTANSSVDSHLWLGNNERVGVAPEVPLFHPAVIHRRDRNGALKAFAAAKRAWFFLALDLQVEGIIDRQSHIPEYVDLLQEARDEPHRAVQRVVAEINRYRLTVGTGKQLHLSRHHRLTAVTRPSVLAASASISSDELTVRLPYLHEDHGVESAGFKPSKLELSWKQGRGAVLSLDYETWRQLHQPRTVHSDRTQEALDMALDLFIGQAPARPVTDPEIIAVDHNTGVRITVTVRGGRRPEIEVNP